MTFAIGLENNLLHLQPADKSFSPIWLEKESVKRFLFGRDVKKWFIDWEGWWVIFPYYRLDNRYKLMPSTEYWDFEIVRGGRNYRVFQGYPENSPRIDKQYPKLWAYLKANEQAFREREGKRFKRKSEEWRWYDFARPQNIEQNFVEKLLMQELATSTTVVRDTHGFVVAGARAYGIVPRVGVDSWFLLGILNSQVFDYHLRHVSNAYNSSGSYPYSDQFIRDFPIAPATEAQQTAIAESARTLTEKTATLRSLEAAVRAFPDSVTAARREAGTVPDLEALERLGLLEGMPLIVQAAQVSSAHDLMGQVILRVGKGRMTLQPALAEVVLAALKVRGRLSYEVLASLNVPEREGEQRAYVATLREWQEQIVRLRGEIIGLEAELNSKVYEVYGLDKKEQSVIEAFLERF